MKDAEAQTQLPQLNNVLKHLSIQAMPDASLSNDLSLNLLSATLSCIDNSVLIIDNHGVLVFANPGARLMLRIEDPQVGQPFWTKTVTEHTADSSLLFQLSRLLAQQGDFEIHALANRITGSLYHGNQGEVKVQVCTQSVKQGTQTLGAVIVVTEKDPTQALLDLKISQLQAIAELGQLALTQLSRDDLFRTAVEMVADTLHTPFCKIIEQLNDGNLVFRAMVGWKGELLSQVLPPEGETHASYSLHLSESVLMYDLDEEDRFAPSLIHEQYHIKSGLTALIKLRDKPYGVLEVDSQQKRDFDQEDQLFMQSIAIFYPISSNGIKLSGDYFGDGQIFAQSGFTVFAGF